MPASIARSLLVVALLLLPHATHADPARGLDGVQREAPTRAAAVAEVDRMKVGAVNHWSPARFQERLSLGLGWVIPRRVYDADGRLLAERSLLFGGRDIERPGFYLALRF
jgi:hypothetical protein